MRAAPVSAICWDVDGTLIDSAIGVTRSVEYALDRMGWPEEPASQLLRHVGPPLERGFMDLSGMDRVQADEAVRIFRERYEATGMHEATVFPGVLEMLSELRVAGVPMATATSKLQPIALLMLDEFGLSEFFDHRLGAGPGRGTKADVLRAALAALRRDGVDVDHSLMVGDRSFDAVGAETVGISFIGAMWGYGSRSELGDTAVDTPAELVHAVLGSGPED